MSQILTQDKTIELGNEIQNEVLKLLKEMKLYPKSSAYSIGSLLFQNAGQSGINQAMRQLEGLLEHLICFCGGCAACQIECRDLYDAYAFLFQMYEDKEASKHYENLSYGSPEFQKKLHKIYYKVSDKTNGLSKMQNKEKNESMDPAEEAD